MTTRPNHLRMRIKFLAHDAAVIRAEELRLVGHSKQEPAEAPVPDTLVTTSRPLREGETIRQTRSVRVGGSIRWLREHQADPKLIEGMEKDYIALRWARTVGHRRMARAALLAYGFLRKQPYRRIEGPTTRPMEPHVVPAVVDYVMEFRPVTVSRGRTEREVQAWLAIPERVVL
jgi:hypothetical protein